MWVNQPVFRRRYSRRHAPENTNLSSQDTERLYCMAGTIKRHGFSVIPIITVNTNNTKQNLAYELGHFVRAAVYNNLKAEMARQNLDSRSSFFLAAKHDMDMRWERREFTRPERPEVQGWRDCEQIIEDNSQSPPNYFYLHSPLVVGTYRHQ